MESHEKKQENAPEKQRSDAQRAGQESTDPTPPQSLTPPEGSSAEGGAPHGAQQASEKEGESAEALSPEQREIRDRVIEILRTVYDPEIPVNIHELGMIYEVAVRPSNEVHVRMTLTSPMCPVAGTLPGEVECKVAAVEGVSAATVELVWEPPWNPSMMSEAARLQLNL